MFMDHVTELQEKKIYLSVGFRPIYSYHELHAASELKVRRAYK